MPKSSSPSSTWTAINASISRSTRGFLTAWVQNWRPPCGVVASMRSTLTTTGRSIGTSFWSGGVRAACSGKRSHGSEISDRVAGVDAASVSSSVCDAAFALGKHAILPVEVHHPDARDDEPGVVLSRNALDLLVRNSVQRAPAAQYSVCGDPSIRDHDRDRRTDLLIEHAFLRAELELVEAVEFHVRCEQLVAIGDEMHLLRHVVVGVVAAGHIRGLSKRTNSGEGARDCEATEPQSTDDVHDQRHIAARSRAEYWMELALAAIPVWLIE